MHFTSGSEKWQRIIELCHRHESRIRGKHVKDSGVAKESFSCVLPGRNDQSSFFQNFSLHDADQPL